MAQAVPPAILDSFTAFKGAVFPEYEMESMKWCAYPRSGFTARTTVGQTLSSVNPAIPVLISQLLSERLPRAYCGCGILRVRPPTRPVGGSVPRARDCFTSRQAAA